MSRRLVVVGVAEDEQAVGWARLASVGRRPARLLWAGRAGTEWHCTAGANGSGVHARVECEDESLEIDDPELCWYLRSPMSAPLGVLEQLSLLHALLAERRFADGGYLLGPATVAWSASKPLQHRLWPAAAQPAARIVVDAARLPAPAGGWITKSLSAVRSVAVALDDRRLAPEPGQLSASPILAQERVDGTPVKVHCYRDRGGVLRTWAVAARAAALDARDDDAAVYEVVEPPPAVLAGATAVGEALPARLYDLDFVAAGEDWWFLEANSSPVPVFYEAAAGAEDAPFSQLVLADWLDA